VEDVHFLFWVVDKYIVGVPKRGKKVSVTAEARHQLGRLVEHDGERDVPAQSLGQA